MSPLKFARLLMYGGSRRYLKAARFFFLFAALFGLVFANSITAMAQSPQPFQASLSGLTCVTAQGSSRSPGQAQLRANLTVTGGQPETIHFNGTATIFVYVGATQKTNMTVSDSDSSSSNRFWSFNPATISYPQTQNVTSISVTIETYPYLTSCTGTMTVNVLSSSGAILATTSGGAVGEGSSDIWYKVVALPLFSDPMLGANNVSASNPVTPIIPGLGDLYNFIMYIAMIILIVGAFFSYGLRHTGLFGEKQQEGGSGGGSLVSLISTLVVGLVVILVFPYIYDEIATVVNYLTQTIIAYPNPYNTYGSSLQILWNDMEFSTLPSWFLITTVGAFFQLAFYIISAIVYIILFFLGVIRIFIIAAMIVAFPISMGLKMFPFTKKLSSMIEDTFFGLILAALMSAIILGVGSYILKPNIWNQTGNIFFQAVGQNGTNWVAAAAIIAAILMPTVFAPLTAMVFQTSSQIAMTGVGAATMIAAGVTTGGIGGVGAGMSGIASATQLAAQTGQAAPSFVQKAAIAAKEYARTAIPAQLAAMGGGLAMGALGGAGATQAARAIRQVTPIVQSPGKITAGAAERQQQAYARGLGSHAQQKFSSQMAEHALKAPQVVSNPVIQQHAQNTYGGALSNTDKSGLLGLAGVSGVAPEILQQMDFSPIQQQINSNPQYAASIWSAQHQGKNVSDAIDGVRRARKGRLKGPEDTPAFGNPTADYDKWKGNVLKWGNDMMMQKGRFLDYAMSRNKEWAKLRTLDPQTKDIINSHLVDKVLQPIQHDERKLFSVYAKLNGVQKTPRSTPSKIKTPNRRHKP